MYFLLKIGEKTDDIFLIIEGNADMLNLELRNKKTLGPGDYFGGILNNQFYFAIVKSKYLLLFILLS